MHGFNKVDLESENQIEEARIVQADLKSVVTLNCVWQKSYSECTTHQTLGQIGYNNRCNNML